MSIGVIVSGVMIGVLQLIILGALGIAMARLGALNAEGGKKFTVATYYLLLPLYCAIGLAGEVYLPDDIAAIGYLAFSFLTSFIVGLVITWLYCKITRIDHRIMTSFIVMCGFGSITAIPVVMAKAVCEDGAPLGGHESCKYVEGYASIGILIVCICLWSFFPMLLTHEKAFCLDIRRKMAVVREFYDTLPEFMNDIELTKITTTQEEQTNNRLETSYAMAEDGLVRDKFYKCDHPKSHENTLDDEDLIAYSLGLNLDYKTSVEFNHHFDKMLEKIDKSMYEQISHKIPKLTPPLNFTCKTVLIEVFSPPVIGSLIGIIIGTIKPLKEALFSDLGGRIFLDTLTTVSTIAVPNLMMVLGSKLYNGFNFDKDVNLRKIDLIAFIVLRLIVVPAFGLIFMVIVNLFDTKEIQENKVLNFIMYAFWNVPPSTQLVSLFVMIGYYLKEMTIIQFWGNLISSVTLTEL